MGAEAEAATGTEAGGAGRGATVAGALGFGAVATTGALAARGGATSLLDVRGAEQLVFTAAAAIADLQRQIAQHENGISVLLGLNPSAVVREASVEPLAGARRKALTLAFARLAAMRAAGVQATALE